MKIRRREFVKTLAKGIPGAFLINAMPALASKTQPEEKEIIYRTLGKTGIRVPIISSGIVPQDNLRLCRAIFRSGIQLFDSAYDYQNGRNSTTIGQMLKTFGRDQYIITTKILLPMDHQTGLYTEEATEELFFKQLDTELERLGVPSVDILYTHKPSNRANILNPRINACLLKAKELGKTRFIGTSNHGNQAECIDAMIEAGIYDIAYVAVNYQQPKEVNDAVNRAAAAGLGIIAMKNHAGGFLDKEQTQPVDKVAAVKWSLQNPNVHTATITFRSYEELEQHLPLMRDITMTEEERAHLRNFSHRAEFASLFCYGCGECIAQCPKQLPIPDTMRAYMYTYGYGDKAKALHTLGKLELHPAACSDCNTCTVQCRHNFAVQERIADMCRLKSGNHEFLA